MFVKQRGVGWSVQSKIKFKGESTHIHILSFISVHLEIESSRPLGQDHEIRLNTIPDLNNISETPD